VDVADGVETTLSKPAVEDASESRVVTARPDSTRHTRKQRRPTGAPPPLPHKIGLSGGLWLGLLVVAFSSCVLFLSFPPTLRFGDHVDTWGLTILANLRRPWLTHVMRALKAAGSGWALTVLAFVTIAVLGVFRRWRHLLVFLGAFTVGGALWNVMYRILTRPRPYGVTIISGWSGFSMPSAPMTVLAALLVAILYSLVVQGRPRNVGKLVVLAILVVVGVARQYLGIENPSDVVFGVILGVSIFIASFRFFTPSDVFPVSYRRRGNAAHLDVTGARGEAIRKAVHDQLGLIVLEIKPFGEEGSGGSTPLRLCVKGDPDSYLFAKLYAKNHVRADRWYKILRTMAKGRMEDEASFQTIRRFVEYEDYTLRLLNDFGIGTPAPFGIVEITPEREYMILMEFFDGAEEIGKVDVDDRIIDEGLRLIRKLWDAGVAHRDIKPANLMVRDGRVLLIDVFFAQVRPSSWRQAVDLGNMMQVLALRTDVERVYRRALQFFTPEEIAEAFASLDVSGHAITSPSQLKRMAKQQGRKPREMIEEFRRLAPPRRPIGQQRWSVRRIALIVGFVVGSAFIAVNGVEGFLPAGNGTRLPITATPACGTDHTIVLMAQAVPDAAELPCIASLPSGWSFALAEIERGRARFWLDSDRAGRHAVTVTLTSDCDVSGAQEVPSDEVGTQRFENPGSLFPRLSDVRFYRFPGGCATYRLSFAPGVPTDLVFDVDTALSFTHRSAVVRAVEQSEGLKLCGAGVSCPG
jgi:tRNA A-37 threonylcarbamoyl transferase component Bud32/membrane-associated phospholipid phosphatase